MASWSEIEYEWTLKQLVEAHNYLDFKENLIKENSEQEKDRVKI